MHLSSAIVFLSRGPCPASGEVRTLLTTPLMNVLVRTDYCGSESSQKIICRFELTATLRNATMKKSIAIATLATVSALTHASTIFSDNFESNAYSYNLAPNGWTVSNGTVDVERCMVVPGKCIDLDGTSFDGGVLSKTFSLIAGVKYTASFELAGNQRGMFSPAYAFDTGTVSFGTQSLNYLVAAYDGFSLYQLAFTPGESGSYSLSFANAGGDNVGALLDNVSVTSVPEPESYALMLLGLGVMGSIARRRKERHA